ncbi:hypothetical protein QAD02_018715 [Eretmocerus hayati]|uniref:Uncharacterized protein n=1 Tax=Eretmocerus hayati TaxID=131215 RepID=A0ACC2PIL6_9HYME|nr:hypothetical protein QAD02_018715 [Eretmocerus hayati]
MVLSLIIIVHIISTANVVTSGEMVTGDAFAKDATIEGDLTTLATPDARNGVDDIDPNEFRDRRSGGGRVVSENVFKKFFPYVVAMYNFNGTYECVGTALTPRLILTAQHCMRKEDPMYSIRANSRDSWFGGEIHWIERAFTYGTEHMNDIAVALLKTRIVKDFKVTLLPPNVYVPDGKYVLALGWGKTKDNSWPRNLMMVSLKVTPKTQCEKEYRGDKWMCTESKDTYTCRGDSGGPILYDGKQVGVISHGDTNCGSGIPTANVNLKMYWDWIQSLVSNKNYA